MAVLPKAYATWLVTDIPMNTTTIAVSQPAERTRDQNPATKSTMAAATTG